MNTSASPVRLLRIASLIPWLTTCCLALIGCATPKPPSMPYQSYEGTRKSLNDVAIVTTRFPKEPVPDDFRGTGIYFLDGKALSTGNSFIGSKCMGSVELLPGKHQLQIGYDMEHYGIQRVYSQSKVPVLIDAQAGHVYLLYSVFSGTDWGMAWEPRIEDVTEFVTLDEQRHIIPTPKVNDWAIEWYRRIHGR